MLNQQKMAKFLLQKTFIRRPIATSAHFEISESVLRFLGLTNFNKVDQKTYFFAIFDEKSLNSENFIKNFSKKNFNQTIQQRSFISNGNKNTLSLLILTYFELY